MLLAYIKYRNIVQSVYYRNRVFPDYWLTSVQMYVSRMKTEDVYAIPCIFKV